VVIAIIGILAAMVFPVFARARESARKAVCLSNVKNIALAVQMYLADNNDCFPTQEYRKEVIDYFNMWPGGHDTDSYNGDAWSTGNCGVIRDGQPYLKWAVLLDEYTKNRDVWRCPSAKMETGAGFIYPVPDWFGYLKATEGQWGRTNDLPGPCHSGFPKGWGGEVTDTVVQGRYAIEATSSEKANKAFVQSIGCLEGRAGHKLAEFGDTVNELVVYEAGPWGFGASDALVAWPDICCVYCGNSVCGWTDWEMGSGECSEWAGDCYYYYAPNDGAFLADWGKLRRYARHLGGSNLGFMDGHVAWWKSEALMAKTYNWEIGGIGCWGPTARCWLCEKGSTWEEAHPGVPVMP
jgi:prepilin-type processing-associated H-X9-DG protein